MIDMIDPQGDMNSGWKHTENSVQNALSGMILACFIFPPEILLCRHWTLTAPSPRRRHPQSWTGFLSGLKYEKACGEEQVPALKVRPGQPPD